MTNADQAASTSALLRRLNGELDQLREQYNAVLLERDQACALSVELLRDTERLREVERQRDAIGARLCEALDANTALSFDHAKALIAVDQLTREVERLDARTARHARAYQLTDKGRAAIETPTPQES